MYVKSIKGYFFYLSVLVAGLTSCSADKTSQATPDTWPRPKIFIVKNGKAVAFGKLDQNYTTADSLKFEFSDPAMAGTVKQVDVQSSCYSDSIKDGANFNYSVGGQSDFKFLNVISEELLAKGDKDLTCLFTLKITNEHGSTKSFDIDLRLKREKEELLKLNFPNSSYVPQPLYSAMMKQVSFAEDLPRGTLSLFCSSFKSTARNSVLSLADLALHAPTPENKGDADSRVTTPKQSCRIIFRADEGERTVSLTPLLNFDFGKAPLEILSRTAAQNTQALDSGNTSLQTYFITNHGEVPASIAFPRGGSLFTTATFLYSVNENPTYGLKVGPFRMPMFFDILGGRVFNTEKLMIVTIAPHQRIEVSLKIDTPKCKTYKGKGRQFHLVVNSGEASGAAIGMVTTLEKTDEIKFLIGLIFDESTKSFQPYEETKLWSGPQEFVQSWNSSIGLNKTWIFLDQVNCQ